jgi:hypothetical protein
LLSRRFFFPCRNNQNIGKLNYYLGKRAYDERGEGRFSDIDFCFFPEATCTEEGERSEEIKWITGMFEWVDRIQSYSDSDWDYFSKLQQFVDGGMTDESFFESVISIFTRGCNSSDCSSIEVTLSEERKENFMLVLGIFGLPAITSSPTNIPTEDPMTQTPSTLSPVKSILPPSLSLVEPSSIQLASLPTPMPTTPEQPSSPNEEFIPLVPLEGNFSSLFVSLSWITALTLLGQQVLYIWYEM